MEGKLFTCQKFRKVLPVSNFAMFYEIQSTPSGKSFPPNHPSKLFDSLLVRYADSRVGVEGKKFMTPAYWIH